MQTLIYQKGHWLNLSTTIYPVLLYINIYINIVKVL